MKKLLIFIIVGLFVSCKSKKVVVTDEAIIKTDIEYKKVEDNSIKTSGNLIYSDSIFVYIVDSVYKDSDGVVHHDRVRREVQKKEKTAEVKSEQTSVITKDSTAVIDSQHKQYKEVTKTKNYSWIGIGLGIIFIIGLGLFVFHKIRLV